MHYPPDVLRMDREEIETLTAHSFPVNTGLTPEVVLHIFKVLGALQVNNNNPNAPHYRLTSGLCSNTYLNCSKVLCYPGLCMLFGTLLGRKYRSYSRNLINWVVGSDHAAATLSFAVASYLGARHDFTQKTADGGQEWKRHIIEPNKTVLQVEDVISTAQTISAVRQGISNRCPGANFDPFILALINRTGGDEIAGRSVLHLARVEAKTWSPEDCPLCQKDSKRILDPKSVVWNP